MVPRLCIAQQGLNVVSETFIRAHGAGLPGVAGIIHERDGRLWCDDAPVPTSWSLAAVSAGLRYRLGRRPAARFAVAYETALRAVRPDVVLAEYGTVGARLVDPCRRVGVPLVVHFHGYDASRRSVLAKFSAAYRRMFAAAAAIVVVSRVMERQLLALGCPRDTLVYSPYGIDCTAFRGAAAACPPPNFVSVGRFVEKKAPDLLLRAFAMVVRERPAARLRMVGDGPLRSPCHGLADRLGIGHAVAFLGSQPHDVVRREMQAARAFVQHSIVAPDGDSEGTPVAVLEAGAAGLPVIATRHAGIPDVVVEGRTGLLVDEHDVHGMARHMLHLVDHPAVADALGRHAATHVRARYTMQQSLRRLAAVLAAAAHVAPLGPVRECIEQECAASTPDWRQAA